MVAATPVLPFHIDMPQSPIHHQNHHHHHHHYEPTKRVWLRIALFAVPLILTIASMAYALTVEKTSFDHQVDQSYSDGLLALNQTYPIGSANYTSGLNALDMQLRTGREKTFWSVFKITVGFFTGGSLPIVSNIACDRWPDTKGVVNGIASLAHVVTGIFAAMSNFVVSGSLGISAGVVLSVRACVEGEVSARSLKERIARCFQGRFS